MGWNQYDPEGIKKAAKDIDRELVTFNKAMNEMKNTVDRLANHFQDSTGSRFLTKYRTQAMPAMEQAKKSMEEYSALLLEAGKRFGNMIDNGNSGLLQ